MDREVYLVLSELGSYRSVHGVFEHRDDAVSCGEMLTEDWQFKAHSVYIKTMNLL